MYRPDCGPVSGLHGILCLSVTGLVFSILFTYSGFILMITGGRPDSTGGGRRRGQGVGFASRAGRGLGAA